MYQSVKQALWGNLAIIKNAQIFGSLREFASTPIGQQKSKNLRFISHTFSPVFSRLKRYKPKIFRFSLLNQSQGKFSQFTEDCTHLGWKLDFPNFEGNKNWFQKSEKPRKDLVRVIERFKK